MSYLITIFKNEESVVLRPRDAINCNSRDLFQISVCIKHLHLLLMMVLVEVEW